MEHNEDWQPFQDWDDARLEKWLGANVYSADPEVFRELLRLWCRRVPELAPQEWDRLHPAVELARREYENERAAREWEAYVDEWNRAMQEQPDPDDYPAGPEELDWEDEAAIAGSHRMMYGEDAYDGDDGGYDDWDADNPDVYSLADRGDCYEDLANEDAWGEEDEDGRFQPGDYFGWLANRREPRPDPAWDDWAADAGTPATTLAPPAPSTPVAPVDAGAPAAPGVARPEPEIRFTNPRHQQGYEFEQWVVSRFPRPFFGLAEWRSDKSCGRWRPRSSGDPDLVMDYPAEGTRKTLAIECKWRSKSRRGTVSLPTPARLKDYRAFARVTEMPVVIVLGIDGTPSHPNEVYVIPLEQSPAGEQRVAALRRFKRRRNAGEMFFWDPGAGELR